MLRRILIGAVLAAMLTFTAISAARPHGTGVSQRRDRGNTRYHHNRAVSVAG